MKNTKGFSLIELMIVVSILTVAAATLLPRFLKHQIQKRQDECRQNLSSLHAAEKEFYRKTGVFTKDLSVLNWQAQGKGFYHYQFIPSSPPQNGFLFECTGNIDADATLDHTTIDETGQMNQITDDTKK